MDIDHASATQQQFWHAISTNDLATARAALALGAGIRTPETRWPRSFPIHRAVYHPHRGALDLLVEAGLTLHDLDARDGFGRPPLFFASMDLWKDPRFTHPANGTMADLPLLAMLAMGADIHAQDDVGNTALHVAVETYFMAGAQALLDHGADPLAPNHKGDTPLSLAASMQGADMKLLIASAVEARALSADTPLPAIAKTSSPPRI